MAIPDAPDLPSIAARVEAAIEARIVADPKWIVYDKQLPHDLAAVALEAAGTPTLLAVLAEREGERHEWVESAQRCITLLTCPYYLGTGTCVSGCRDEPACQTNDTLRDAVVLLHRIADAEMGDEQ